MNTSCGATHTHTPGNQPTATANASLVFENGTIMGAVVEYSSNGNGNTGHCHNNTPEGQYASAPEIVISANRSRSKRDIDSSTCGHDNGDDTAVESTALLAHPVRAGASASSVDDSSEADALPHDDFEQFVLNRSTSDSNILESSIYSELQFPPSIGSGCGNAAGYLIGSTTALPQQQHQLPSSASAASAHELADLLNTSTCSRESSSRASKRSRRKHKPKAAKWGTASSAQDASAALSAANAYPPQYTAIFLEHGNVAANAMGQIASAAAASPFLNAPLADANAYLQQQYQLISAPYAIGRHLHHRRLIDSASLPPPLIDSANTALNGSAPLTPAPAASSNTLTPAERSTFRKCFSRPVVPFVIGIFALGGAACTLGGIVLGATGLIEHTTHYLSASLLMIGIGLSLLIVAGIIWRLSSPSDADECPCYRLMETCRNCNSPYCNNRLLTGSYLYPEFQHRPPPPSYLTSLHECAAIGLLNGAVYSGLRMNTPPPLYRSTNSLSLYVPSAHSTNAPPFSAATAVAANNAAMLNVADIVPEQNVININAVIENLQAQAQAQAQAQTQTQAQTLTKEINYLELD